MKQPSQDKSTVNDAVKNLYNVASEDFDLGTYDEFESKLQDTTKRRKFYNAIRDAYDVGNYDNFNQKIDNHFKKKVSTESPLDLAQGLSTSDEYRMDTFAPFLPRENGRPKDEGFDMIPEQLVNLPVAELYDAYKEAGVITSTQIQNIDDEIERQEKGDRSLWEDADALITGMLNTGMAIPLYKYDSKEDLMVQQAIKNRVDFLEALPKEKVEELNAYAVRQTGELSKESRNTFAENAIIEEKSKSLINNIKHTEDAIRRLHQNGKQVPPEGVQHYQGLIRELQGIAGMYNKNVDIIEANNTDLGEFYEELEFFKKNYGGLEYYQDIMRLSSADLIAGIFEFGSSTIKMGHQPGQYLAGLKWEQLNKEFRTEVSRQREFIKPMMSVSDIENARDFGKWLLEQSSSQLPVITVLAAGGAPVGLPALGTSAAGQKMGQMRDEMNRPLSEGQKKKEYSEAEIYIAGLGVGAAEVLSERVSLGILSKGKRALSSIRNTTLKQQLRQGVKDRLMGFVKAAGQEGVSEFLNQIVQNSIDILYLGDQDVHILDNTEDALATGLAMGGGMNMTPALIGMGAKAFMKREIIDEVKTDAKMASNLLAEAESKKDVLDQASYEMLVNKAKGILEENDAKISKAYGDIQNLEKSDIKELIDIDKKANKILAQVNTLQKSDIDPEFKKNLVKDFEVEINNLREQKNKILDNITPLSESESRKITDSDIKDQYERDKKDKLIGEVVSKIPFEDYKARHQIHNLEKTLQEIEKIAPEQFKNVEELESEFDNKDIFNVAKKLGIKVYFHESGKDNKIEEIIDGTNESIRSTFRDNVYGFYPITGSYIYINRDKLQNSQINTNVIQHEVIHAYTSNLLKKSDKLLTEPERRFKNEVKTAYEQFKRFYDITSKKGEPTNLYGFKKAEEFITEYLSNPKFKGVVDRRNKSFYQKVVNFIKGVFGKSFTDTEKLDNSINEYHNYILNINKKSKDATKIDVVREEGDTAKGQEQRVGNMPKIDRTETAPKKETQETVEPTSETIPAKETEITEQAQTEQTSKKPKKESKPKQEAIRSGKQETVESRRNESLTSERIPPAKKTPTDKSKKLKDILSNVSEKLKATTVYGKTGSRSTIGTYYPSSGLVRVKNAGDIDTAAHELGHMIDDRFNVTGKVLDNKEMTDQLKWFSDRGGSNPPSNASQEAKIEYLKREGMGEFIRAYIANPEAAKNQAPELYNHFESTVDESTLSALKEFSEDFTNLANASYGEQILSNVDDSTLPDKKGFKQWMQNLMKPTKKSDKTRFELTWVDKMKTALTNSMEIPNKAFRFMMGMKDTGPLKVEDNFEMMSKLFAGFNGKVNSFLKNGLRDPKNKLYKDSKGETMDVNYLFEGLDTTSKKTLKEDMDEVIKLLVAERTIEYADKFERSNQLTGVGAGIRTDLHVANGYMEEFNDLKNTDKSKFDRITEGARRYREFADAGLKYALESGRLSQEGYDTIKDNNRYYVSLARNKEVAPGEDVFTAYTSSNKLGSAKDVIKKAKGGTDMIKNPYMSLIRNTVNIVKEADRNRLMQTFVEPLDSVQRSMGEQGMKDFAQIGYRAKKGDNHTLPVFKDGVEETWGFNEEIYKILKGLGESPVSSMIITILSKPATLLRESVTSFPVFALRNFIRDTQSRLILSRVKGKRAKLSSLNAILNKDVMKDFEAYGGAQAGFYLVNENAYKKKLTEAVDKLTKKGNIIFMNPLKAAKEYNPLALGRKLGQAAENVNRLAEYKAAYKKAKDEGMDDYNAGLYAAYQARDLMDFAVAGNFMREVNKVIPFSNAAVQSIKRSVKGAKENPMGFMGRMAVWSVLPQVIFHALVIAAGDEEEYEELPDYQRDLFYNVKLPGSRYWITIPKPFELGLVSSIMDRSISRSRGNKKAFDGSLESALKIITPVDQTSVLGSFKPWIEVMANKDFFRDKSIIPPWEEKLDIELREGTKYASQLGKAIGETFGTDPRQVDHILRGYTTYWGDFGQRLFNIGSSGSRYKFDWGFSGVAKDMPVAASKSVREAFDLAESIGEQNRASTKALKQLIRKYYATEDRATKIKLGEKIRNRARKLTDKLERKKELKLKKSEKKKALK